MKIQVRYFASLREQLGAAEQLEVPPGTTLGALRDLLAGRDESHADALSRRRAVRCALDQAMCDESRALHDGAEVAFFPPVTGG